MSVDWSPLQDALAACRRDNVAVPFWWRDDDAIVPTPALDHLSSLARGTGVPVHLAVIPAHATPELPQGIDPAWVIPVVHGWAHHDHSGGAGKKNEFLTPRTDAVDDTKAGLEKMQTLFGPALRPMFVPPWNRISDSVTATLHDTGYSALSTFGPRMAAQAPKGLDRINTHIDPIWWKGNRDLVDPDQLIAHTAQHLHARRTGAQDAAEPLGLLTHHLVHSAAIWDFTERFVHELTNGGATPWEMETTT